MPRAGTAARRCERAGLPPVKPGKVGWVHGSKLPFFQAHKDKFLAAAETGGTAAFYKLVVQLYLGKYGYNVPWTSDLKKGQDVADDVDPDEDIDVLLPEMAAGRAAYFILLRKKIAVWYNAQYGSAQQKKPKQTKTFKQLFDKHELEPPKPVKARTIYFYSRHFYEECIKPRVDRRWAAMSRQQQKPGKAPAWITVRNMVTAEAWEAEPAAFRAEVMEAVEKEHDVAREAYNIAMARDVPSSAEEYTVALENSVYYLQPFIDAAHTQIELRSLHAGFLNDLAPRVWSDYDRAGFAAAERSFVAFTQNCFTEEQCRLRAVGRQPGTAATDTDDTEDDMEPLSAMASSASSLSPSPPGSPHSMSGPPRPAIVPVSATSVSEEPVPTIVPVSATSASEEPVPTTVPASMTSTSEEPVMSGPLTSTIIPTSETSASVSEVPVLSGPLTSTIVPASETSASVSEVPVLSGPLMSTTVPASETSASASEVPVLSRPLTSAENAAPLPPNLHLPEDLSHPLTLPNGTGWDNSGDHGFRLGEFGLTNFGLGGFGLSNDMGLGDDMGLDDDMGLADISNNYQGPVVGQALSVEIAAMSGGEDVETWARKIADEEAALAQTARMGSAAVQGGGDVVAKVPVVTRLVPKPAWRGAGGVPAANTAAAGEDLVVNKLIITEEAEMVVNMDEMEKVVEKVAEEDGRAEAVVEEEKDEGESEGKGEADWKQEVGGVWDKGVQDAWPEELKMVFKALERAKEWGKEAWEFCVTGLIELEEAWNFPEKGLLTVPQGGKDIRPEEVPLFMRMRRKWENEVALTSVPGPVTLKGSFAERWWTWWEHAQPEACRLPSGKLMSSRLVETKEFTDVSKMAGRNGMLLYVGALLWWGEAARAVGEGSEEQVKEWKIAVVDVGSVLAFAKLLVKSPEAADQPSAIRDTSAREKRKQPDSTSQEKENVAPKKHRKSTRASRR
ncbi:hypothetical protein K438DRAFT_1959508 [Mycena galopus ATCC 62051]|nr:hypothetical protein K438DRAFT_1959508 [Mycena galopus ATCC 62051]